MSTALHTRLLFHSLAALALALSLLCACNKTESASDSDAETASAAAAASNAAAAASASASASAQEASSSTDRDSALVSLELQELTFTSEVKNKEPVDLLTAAEPGTRVWAHLRLRNRGDSPRAIKLQFYVNNDRRTFVELKVEKSWSYRTWAYNTILPADKSGMVRLEVTDDRGEVLADTSVPIAAKAGKKPYVKKTP